MATAKTSAPAANDGRRSIQSIEVGVPLLAALVDAAKPLTLRDLAAGAGMTSAKAHPYLVSFIRVGLVQQDSITGQYELCLLYTSGLGRRGGQPLRDALNPGAGLPVQGPAPLYWEP